MPGSRSNQVFGRKVYIDLHDSKFVGRLEYLINRESSKVLVYFNTDMIKERVNITLTEYPYDDKNVNLKSLLLLIRQHLRRELPQIDNMQWSFIEEKIKAPAIFELAKV